MSFRQRERFDYRVYNKTGEKVRKIPTSMEDHKQIILDEQKILDSLSFHLALYAIDDLFSEEECRGAIGTVTDLYNSYRSIHVELN